MGNSSLHQGQACAHLRVAESDRGQRAVLTPWLTWMERSPENGEAQAMVHHTKNPLPESTTERHYSLSRSPTRPCSRFKEPDDNAIDGATALGANSRPMQSYIWSSSCDGASSGCATNDRRRRCKATKHPTSHSARKVLKVRRSGRAEQRNYGCCRQHTLGLCRGRGSCAWSRRSIGEDVVQRGKLG